MPAGVTGGGVQLGGAAAAAAAGRRLASAVQVALASAGALERADTAVFELMHGAHKSL